jgi:hypothetical protein
MPNYFSDAGAGAKAADAMHLLAGDEALRKAMAQQFFGFEGVEPRSHCLRDLSAPPLSRPSHGRGRLRGIREHPECRSVDSFDR